MLLRELASDRPPVEFINRLLSEILATADVNGFYPALFAPAPCRARRHANLLQPGRKADDGASHANNPRR